MKKRGQVTIFIILAIIIVAGIVSFFVWVKPTMSSSTGARFGFSGCIQNSLEDKIAELEKTGGIINPGFIYKYQDEVYPYFCYSSEYYLPCTMQVPFPDAKFEEQLEIALREEINSCYTESLEELKSQGYEVVQGDVNYDITLEQNGVKVKIDAPTIAGSQKFAKFNVQLDTPIYEMTMIATSILQYETSYGDSDTDTLSTLYPDYKITKLKMTDGSTLYTIESKLSENKYRFATRSMVFPPGYDI